MRLLPIHAAGYHDLGPQKNALDRVISSYASTIKSLLFARKKSRRAFNDPQKMMLVGMPRTAGKTDLPGVDQEVKELENLFSAQIPTTIFQSPTRETVLKELRKFEIVHFACHGDSNLFNPTQSCLYLSDGPLTVSDVTSLNIQSCQLAYLSACHTATTKEVRLLDESINISYAMQLAGFPSVIGTLWQVNDASSAEIAKEIYGCMLEGSGKLDVRRSAEGLHKSIRRLRDKTRRVSGFSKELPNDPLVWAPYIHLGA